MPSAFRALVDAARAARAEEAAAIDTDLRPLYDLLGIEPNPTPVKALLAELGQCQDALRLPLLPLSQRGALVSMATRVREVESRCNRSPMAA